MVALGLLSPLVLYANRRVMPLVALFAVAAGIVVSLGVAGRRLHAVLLADALAVRGSRARAALTVSLMLLVVLCVFVGIVVCLVLVFRTSIGGVIVP